MALKFSAVNQNLLDEAVILETARTLKDYVDHLRKVADSRSFDFNESSINLPYDSSATSDSEKLVKKFESKDLKYIFVIGIGGSNLGTMAIYNALFGQLDYLNAKLRLPKVVFLETVSAKFFVQVRDIIQNQLYAKEEVVVNIISKSGGTTETISLFELVYE